MASVDMSVRGAGIFGLSVAWAAVKAGATVELVDPNGVASGASGGIVGALAPHVPENWNPKKQFQLESLLMAQDYWADIADVSGKDPGYSRAGRIQPIEIAGLQLAKDRAHGAQMLWQGRATWDVISDAEGWDIPSTSGFFVKDTLSAHIHPRQACQALAAALQARGVSFVSDPQAAAKATVWATGAAGLAAVSNGQPRIMGQGIKGQAALFALDKRGAPQAFVNTLHMIPHLDGTVAVGSTTEREFDDPFDTDARLNEVIARARAAVPELAHAPVIQRWAGLRPRARSRAPMLGAWPDTPGHYIANGGFKIGFGMAPKIGEVMADFVLNGVDRIPQGFHVADNF